MPNDHATVVHGGVTGATGLASTEADGSHQPLLADAVYELGDDSWSLNEVEFTSHPFLNTDTSGTVLSLGPRQEYIRLESNASSEFDWIVASTPSGDSTTHQTDWYVEYYVNNQWSLGRVVNSNINSRIPNPTGSVVYVDPVDSVVNIQDTACRLSVADRTNVTVAADATHATTSLNVTQV